MSKRMRPGWFAVSALMVMGAMAAWPFRSAACSCADGVICPHDPERLGDGLAIDQAMIVRGYLDPATFQLEDEDGTSIEFEVRSGLGTARVIDH